MMHCRIPAKYFVLVLLVLQNTGHVMLMRHSRTRPGTLFLASTAVCCDEASKLLVCLGILFFSYICQKRGKSEDDGDGGEEMANLRSGDEYGDRFDPEKNVGGDVAGAEGGKRVVRESFASYLREQLRFDIRVAGIAGLYTVQKNLIFLAISNLNAVTYQVLYQGKFLTTAFFSVVLLQKKLSCRQIGGLFLLTAAVVLVQIDETEDGSDQSFQESHKGLGLAAVFCACCTSGFGGVYFELVLKPRQNSNPGEATTPRVPSPSVWAKNVQLSAFGLAIALVTAFGKDHAAILSDGFFQGYTPLVLWVIAFQAGGGLIVAAVIKYADSILKNFASAFSIIATAIVGAILFGHDASQMFLVGCFLIFVSIWLYTTGNPAVTGDRPDSKENSLEKHHNVHLPTAEPYRPRCFRRGPGRLTL